MEFRETLLAAQRNQQQKSSESQFYKAKFDPPKKEHKPKDKLSANIQKFLAKKDEEDRQKKLDVQRKRDELQAMRDPKALRKIQKTLKVIKSANKSVIADAIDRDNTAVTRDGPDQPDQDDYGYESQEAAALYEKMMQKYSKIPDEPKFSSSHGSVKKDINGTRERVKHALQHEDDPVPHKRVRRRKEGNDDKELSPPPKSETERKRDEKPSKVRKPMPPPMDFTQLLKLAEQKKSEPLAGSAPKKVEKESEPERLMTKQQRREYEEEQARRQRRQERIEAEKSGSKKILKSDRPAERERKPESSGFGRIPKLGDKANGNYRHNSPKANDKERDRLERDRVEKLQREKERAMSEKEKLERERQRQDRERLDRLKAERDRIDREMERLNKDREKVDRTKAKLESIERRIEKSKLVSKEPLKQDAKKNIDLKTQNTYRIDKNFNERKLALPSNKESTKVNGVSGKVPQQQQRASLPQKGHSSQDRLPSKQKSFDGPPKVNGHRPEEVRRIAELGKAGKRPEGSRPQPGPSKPAPTSFDFNKHLNSLKNAPRRPQDVKRKPSAKAKRRLDSESEYDSEMDDFIDDGDENMDYSSHIKEIFGYDKSRYRDMDDDDDPSMVSSFAQVQREEYISKKQGILEDLEDMRLEAMQKAKKTKKKRQISDD